ncbi:hypothetical protein [Streptomyces werraensis]|uniref:hypothetical protein n=1 Tax=Streptomyces werraensis TaxID=68284 RepID=UPI0037CFA036
MELLDPLRGGCIADQSTHSHTARPGKLLLVLRFFAQLSQHVHHAPLELRLHLFLLRKALQIELADAR